MPKLPAATEQKLLTVIEKTAALVADEGLSPNEAIIKTAGEHQLRPSEISLVVHAYNTGRTGRQQHDGGDPFEKSAEFELADTESILERIYPSTVKTAAAIAQDTAVAAEYLFGPVPMLERKRWQEKRADNTDWTTFNGIKITPPPPLPRDNTHRIRVAMGDAGRQKTAFEESRRVASHAYDTLARRFNELTEYFRQPNAYPLAAVKEAAVLLHGRSAAVLCDQLAAVAPHIVKLATTRATVHDLDGTATPFDLIAATLAAAGDYNTKQAAFEAATQTYESEVGRTAVPFVDRSASLSILDPSFDAHHKQAFDINDPLRMLGTYSLASRTLQPLTDKLKGPDDSFRLNKAVTQLNDPAHEQKLREINTQATLQDLMLNDEVISGYDPHDVTSAFNDITQISPSVADQRMLMQVLLRKKLQQGQLDTFEQDQLLGFEDKLRRQAQPVQGGKADGSVI